METTDDSLTTQFLLKLVRTSKNLTLYQNLHKLPGLVKSQLDFLMFFEGVSPHILEDSSPLNSEVGISDLSWLCWLI